MPVSRRIVAVLAACLAVALAVPMAVGGGGLDDRKEAVDAELERLKQEVAEAKRRESVLTSDIRAANEQITVVSQTLAGEEAQLLELEGSLDRRRSTLERLRGQFGDQSRLLRVQVEQARLANQLLEERIVELYKSDGTDTFTEILLDVQSLTDIIDQLEYLREIANRDQEIVASVRDARRATRRAREETRILRSRVAEQTRLVSARTREQRAARDSVVVRERQLITARADRSELLASVRAGRDQTQEEIVELELASDRLERRIIAAQQRSFVPASYGSGSRPASGFVLPVGGVLTSGFGLRWGRLHAGIDIGAPFGAPISAVAAGVVIYSGWLGGYGNLVVVDHGDGVSTAYAHQQRIAVDVGDTVSQGATLGEVGSTGYSTGPHLHFEVRINGVARDPLGYL